jgi:UDP:flavonoid glycosyltransferase YjiC (YdhE family)
MPESPWLNLYLYPDVADYRREQPLAPTWHRLDSCVRETDGTWELPDRLRGGDGGLIYLSLGSLGSADVGLLQRLVDVLGTTRHRVIVSKGPLADQIRLHDNMVGEAILPQPAILPQVDLVVTHGGNNTVTECFNVGVPMVVLPLFWDQVDNAQRVDETGFGIRLPAYAFEDPQLTGAIDRLLADQGLRERMAVAAARYQANPGTVAAADRIERVARTGQPVLR